MQLSIHCKIVRRLEPASRMLVFTTKYSSDLLQSQAYAYLTSTYQNSRGPAKVQLPSSRNRNTRRPPHLLSHTNFGRKTLVLHFFLLTVHNLLSHRKYVSRCLLFFLTPRAGLGLIDTLFCAYVVSTTDSEHLQDLAISHSTQKRMDGIPFSDHGSAPPITPTILTNTTRTPAPTSQFLR